MFISLVEIKISFINNLIYYNVFLVFSVNSKSSKSVKKFT